MQCVRRFWHAPKTALIRIAEDEVARIAGDCDEEATDIVLRLTLATAKEEVRAQESDFQQTRNLVTNRYQIRTPGQRAHGEKPMKKANTWRVNKDTGIVYEEECTKATAKTVTYLADYGRGPVAQLSARNNQYERWFTDIKEAVEFSQMRIALLREWIDRAQLSVTRLGGAAQAADCDICGRGLTADGKCGGGFVNHKQGARA